MAAAIFSCPRDNQNIHVPSKSSQQIGGCHYLQPSKHNVSPGGSKTESCLYTDATPMKYYNDGMHLYYA